MLSWITKTSTTKCLFNSSQGSKTRIPIGTKNKISTFAFSPFISSYSTIKSNFVYNNTPKNNFRYFSTSTPQNDLNLNIMESTIQRLKEINNNKEEKEKKGLRVAVEAGGCSGFKYVLSLDSSTSSDDLVIEREGEKIFIDSVTSGLLNGATIEYSRELMREGFSIKDNPNASSSCGCSMSFNLKN